MAISARDRMGMGGAAAAFAGLLALTVGFGPGAGAAPGTATSSSRAVFERRIRPLLDAKTPSSCSECHLSGVDLKDYIRPSESQTFAALRAQGLVNVQRPDESRILRFIRMSRPKTPLVTSTVRDVEYGAFRDWIVAAASDPKLKAASAKAPAPPRTGPAVPVAVIRHTRIDSVVASFGRNVWSQEGRCMNCHEPGNQANIAKYGARVNWFVPDDPEATMDRLIAQGDVNVEKPEESLLLLKPLNKVPHGGGVKMLYGDAGYKLFRAWLEDYSRSVKGGYRSASDLPSQPNSALVNLGAILNLTNGPSTWADRLVRVDVYDWDAGRGDWADRPLATGERGMFASRAGAATSTNLIMFLVVPNTGPAPAASGADEDAAAPLRARLATPTSKRFLLKYYCDADNRLSQDYALPTDSQQFYRGSQEVAVASWSGGWARPVRVSVAPRP